MNISEANAIARLLRGAEHQQDRDYLAHRAGDTLRVTVQPGIALGDCVKCTCGCENGADFDKGQLWFCLEHNDWWPHEDQQGEGPR